MGLQLAQLKGVNLPGALLVGKQELRKRVEECL